jgi:RNA polymerase sigma-70 factor (ECF subfamily)
LKKREVEAVQYTVETYAPRLYRFAMYQIGNNETAEDIASEVVARMLEKIDGYTYKGAPFQTWLFSIARNLITDLYRKKMKAQVISLSGSEGQKETEEIGSIDSGLESLADRDELLRAMRLLTEDQRQIVTLRLVEGWEPAEIAQLLGRSVDSVKSLQYRALQAMKRALIPGGMVADSGEE